MCTSPILIRNRKYVKLGVTLPSSFIKVPCGLCDECLRKRAKDLFVRARFESEDTLKNGGTGFMCTLTYDDDNLPFLDYDGRRFMVFSKRDVQNFIKRLRIKLDRFYRTHFGSDAPDFKYLVTSEYGTNPYCTHRPHYHMIILFCSYVSLYIFRDVFKSCLSSGSSNRNFGKIFQCDLLDISKGGVRYTSKYILKDVTYNNQNVIIRKLIRFYTDYVNTLHSIISCPETEDDFFINRCIRSSKSYRADIEKYVRPFRDMLQFYLVSNDFGVSSIIRRYGETLFTLGCLNIDKLPYSIPKQVILKIERTLGSEKRDLLNKSIFLNHFRDCIEDVVHRGVSTRSHCERLFDFAKCFLQPRYGYLYFVSPFSDYYANFTNSPVRDYDDILCEFGFYDDNDFFTLRNDVYSIINLSNCKENFELRSKIARSKSVNERNEYLKKKFNKS